MLCECKKCVEYMALGNWLKGGRVCRICGKAVIRYNMFFPPGGVCNECWREIPDYIPKRQSCNYINLKLKNAKM